MRGHFGEPDVVRLFVTLDSCSIRPEQPASLYIESQEQACNLTTPPTPWSQLILHDTHLSCHVALWPLTPIGTSHHKVSVMGAAALCRVDPHWHWEIGQRLSFHSEALLSCREACNTPPQETMCPCCVQPISPFTRPPSLPGPQILMLCHGPSYLLQAHEVHTHLTFTQDPGVCAPR